MQSIKQEALDAINKLPANVTIEEIMYRLYVTDKINAGLDDVLNGRMNTLEELKREVQSR